MAVCLITGCDKGIGRALALNLHERGETVIATCLGDSEELRSKGLQVEANIDVCDDEALKALADRLNQASIKIDMLINNAGILHIDELGKIDYDDCILQFKINALGPLRVTEALLSCLAEKAKVGIITSRVGSLSDNTSGGLYAYRISKCAGNMVGMNLFHDLKKRDMTVVLLHPGTVDTDLVAGFEADFIQPEEAAAGLIKQVDEAKLGVMPDWRHSNGQLLPW